MNCPAHIAERIESDIRQEAAILAATAASRECAELRRYLQPKRAETWAPTYADFPDTAALFHPDYCDYLNDISAEDRLFAFGEIDCAQVESVADISPEDRAFAFSAEGEYLTFCREKTGDTMPDDKREKAEWETAHLLKQTAELADRMRGAGFEALRDTPFELRRYYIHSRQWEMIPAYRRTVFLPYVAQALRAPIVAALEHWLASNLFARFWTFTSGNRVGLSGVRERVKWLHRKLNELNQQPFMRELGVRIVFRSTELGTPEANARGDKVDGSEIERDEDGALCFHVHAHCVVEMAGGFVPPEKWSKLLEKVNAFWPAVFLEGSIIRNARECCKYVTKPRELLKLTGAELVALQEQLFRLKLVQPMGSLAADITAREAAGKRLVRRTSPDGRYYYAAKNWNRHVRRSHLERAQDAAEKMKPSKARGLVRIVSRGLPRFGKCGVAEPVVTVMAMRGSWDEKAVRTHRLVEPLIRATSAEFMAGLQIKVHTRTPTTEPKPATPESWRKSGLKRAPLGAEARGF